jgi:hypothetical protein
MGFNLTFKPLNAELNPICHLMALLRTHHILHVSRIRVKELIRIMAGEIGIGYSGTGRLGEKSQNKTPGHNCMYLPYIDPATC